MYKMNITAFTVVFVATLTIAAAQRSFYLGDRGNGYKDRFAGNTEPNVNNGVPASRFGGSVDENKPIDRSTEKLPIDAHGDRETVDIIRRKPIDQQPFWFINADAIEKHRNTGVNFNNPVNTKVPLQHDFSITTPFPFVYPVGSSDNINGARVSNGVVGANSQNDILNRSSFSDRTDNTIAVNVGEIIRQSLNDVEVRKLIQEEIRRMIKEELTANRKLN